MGRASGKSKGMEEGQIGETRLERGPIASFLKQHEAGVLEGIIRSSGWRAHRKWPHSGQLLQAGCRPWPWLGLAEFPRQTIAGKQLGLDHLVAMK